MNEIIKVQGSLLVLDSSNVSLHVAREDCPDVAVTISPEDPNELYVSAYGCDIVLDSYCDGGVFLHIRKQGAK